MHRRQASVKEFHEKFGCPIGQAPGFRDVRLRLELVGEEFNEFVDACDERDLPAAADAIGDLIYVLYGAAVAWGIDMEPIETAIHRANMAKEGGGRREDGKITKPAGWQAPDIAGELRKQGWGG